MNFYSVTEFVRHDWDRFGMTATMYAGTQLSCTLLACWVAGCEDSWLILTDLPPSAADPCWYAMRSWIETDYWQVKMHLGLGDYRIRSYEAISRWYSVVYLVLIYLYWRKYEHQKKPGCTISLSEVIQAIRQEHQRECLREACQKVAEGEPLEEVLERYLGLEVLAVA